MSFGYCYSGTGSRCSGKAQPGAIALRDVIMEVVAETGSLGIYNCRPKRTGRSLSVHAEGRAWDCAIGPDEVEVGDRLAQFLVDHAQELGIQRVIWGFGRGKAPKEWDARVGERYWEPYEGPAHDDHIHGELCWEAAKRLTHQQVRDVFKAWDGEEDWLAMATEEEVRKIFHEELQKLAQALLSKNDDTAAAGGAHFGVSRGQSLMNVETQSRSYAKRAANNTDHEPVPVSEPVPVFEPVPVSDEPTDEPADPSEPTPPTPDGG